jgi:hypothetical protein
VDGDGGAARQVPALLIVTTSLTAEGLAALVFLTVFVGVSPLLMPALGPVPRRITTTPRS